MEIYNKGENLINTFYNKNPNFKIRHYTSPYFLLDKKKFDQDLDLSPVFYKSDKLKVCYIQINKCASTSIISELVEHHQFEPVYENDDNFIKYKNEYNFFIVVRDPKTRWVSGINEFLSNYNIGFDNLESELKKDRFVFDYHTTPQFTSIFACGVDKDNFKDINLIKLDCNLDNKISNIIKKTVSIPKINISNIDEEKNKRLNNCNFIFEKYCKNNIKFNTLYELDFGLYALSD